MAKKDVSSVLFDLFEESVLELGFELCDVEFLKERQNWFVRVYVDKEGGIKIEDCELTSRTVEKILDEKDPVSQTYILEVSSPGIDRVLKKDREYEKYRGKMVNVKLYKQKDGAKEFTGELLGLVDGKIAIKEETGREIIFEKLEVAACRLHVIF